MRSVSILGTTSFHPLPILLVKAPVKQDTETQLVLPCELKLSGPHLPLQQPQENRTAALSASVATVAKLPTLEPASSGAEVKNLPPLRFSEPQPLGLLFLPPHIRVEKQHGETQK